MESMTIQSALSAYPLLQLDPSTSPCLAEQTSLFLQSIQLSAEPVSVTNDMTTLLALVAGGTESPFYPQVSGIFACRSETIDAR